MSSFVVQNEIAGASVYGVKQYDYSVDGEAGRDYAAALVSASFREATTVEKAQSAVAEVVKARQRKVDAIGTALATVSQAIADMKTKNQEPSDTSSWSDRLYYAAEELKKYGINIPVGVDNSKKLAYLRRDNAMRAQSDLQYAMDVEDNNLQQDIVSLQSLMSKRDNAFSTAAKIVRKALNAAGNTISNIS